MKILPRWVTVLVAIVQFASLGTTSFAQLSPANGYLGKIGTNDILVSVARRDLVAVYFFDRTLGRLELATAALDSQGRATVAANTGRIVTIAVTPDFTTGSIGGIPFVAAVEKPYGPRSAESRAYSGTGIDLTSNSNTSSYAVLLFAVFASGKVVLIAGNAAGSLGGLGTITPSGVVTIPMTTGRVFTFLFAPQDGIAQGQITSPGTATTTYFLAQTQRAPIINIATRGTVGGGQTLTAGFVTGTGAKVLLIRAIGPTLGAFGVPDTQADPALTLYSGNTVIATNNDWGAAPNAADMPAAAAQAGAFGLTAGSRDAVLLVTLEAGAYTAQVTGTGAAGEALVEVYEIR